MRPLLLALCFWFLAALFLSQGCYTVQVPEEQGWQMWPRRGSVPLASDDCMTDICLQHREYILESNLGPNENREE